MLTHNNPELVSPSRIVVVGAGGFVGSAAVKNLTARGVPVTCVARPEVDLLSVSAAGKLSALLRNGDTIVMIAARAPVKSNSMLIDNLRMMDAVCVAIGMVPPEHVIYVSSDAVYADSKIPLSEESCAQPGSLHGVMHLAREIMLADACKAPLCILRPTLIYGASDPHNGYGPNRFRRLAQRGEEIVLFGKGEEQRDHVHVDDVAELIGRCAVRKSEGILNIATGAVTTFRSVAEKVAALVPNVPSIRDTARKGPMPHRGYRAFDASSTTRAFPDFQYTSLELGLALSQKQEFPNGRN